MKRCLDRPYGWDGNTNPNKALGLHFTSSTPRVVDMILHMEAIRRIKSRKFAGKKLNAAVAQEEE